MSDAFRQKVITMLINEIALLTGGRFEQFGYRIMGVIHTASGLSVARRLKARRGDTPSIPQRMEPPLSRK